MEEAVLLVHAAAEAQGPTISRHIYGHFAEHLGRCIYEGLWVGEGSPIPATRGIRDDVVEALRRLQPAVLRWPGGCFADDYHWTDGIGPREQRPARINAHWGRVIETNHFGTHEFFDLCERIGAEPYICGNVGSGSVREMREWVEYITFAGASALADLRRRHGRGQPWRLPFFGVGNENWGCGGNMRAEYYADEYRRYATYVRTLDPAQGRIQRIACGPNGGDYHWTEVLMREAGRHMEGLALHYYTHVPRGAGLSESATEFGEREWFAVLKAALRIRDLLRQHSAIMDRYDPERRVALVVDEWGTWYRVEPGTNPSFLYQQNTLRDALVAALHLHAFHDFAERVRLACIAQMVNVLQAMVLTRGAEMLCTPTYHVFEMFRVHQDARRLPVSLRCAPYTLEGDSIPALSASASRAPDGTVHLSLCHTRPDAPLRLTCELWGITPTRVAARVLTADAMQAHNTFEEPERVRPTALDGIRVEGRRLELTLPSKSVAVLEVR